ncbi:hypothetical protein OTU49_004607 [Cherax quadricarinatus]|uniref:Uncharacterized protein n=1 Tax=Cherax quadricarinatus TaxID=27406 RepID=A0AAW0XAV0_CHEQU
MRMLWRAWMLGVVMVVGVARCEDRWVWGNIKASSIPGYVEPTTASPLEPTTFRPQYQPVGRAAASQLRHFPRVTANPYFVNAFQPFSLVPPPRTSSDGTTKSRVTTDTAFDGASGAVLDAGDKYTTLDRLQSERGAPPAFPRPEKHQLGGLHPDEVFYADDDLLIIKGGGFNSDAFEEPSQPLDADDDDIREGSATRVSSVVAPLPSPHQEYNGNIPAIVPYPQRMSHQPLSLFVEGASTNNYILVPYVFQQPGVGVATADGTFNNHIDNSYVNLRKPLKSAQYVYHIPYQPVFLTHHNIIPVVPQAQQHPSTLQQAQQHPSTLQQVQQHPSTLQQVQQHPSTLKLPHSLAGDTAVNYRHPRPPINPDAELVVPSSTSSANFFYPGSNRRQQSRPRL